MTSEILEPRDVTFRNYTTDQASDYAAGRLGYTDALIDFILNYHRSTNGETACVLDVGCGPGTATQKLAPHFDLAYGVDPGESMIRTATELGGRTRSGGPIVYKLSTAEDIDKINGILQSSVDMITAATAAHWFDMPRFWAAAAKVLKPGGTIAIWTVFRQPGSFNNNNELQSIFNDFLDALAPYSRAGTHLTQSGYVDLPMPWDNPDTSKFYDQQASARHVLTADDGFVANTGRKDRSEGNSDESVDKQVQRMERLVGTFGSLSRWQKGNPELVGTEKDPARILMGKVRQMLEGNGKPIELTALAAKMAVALILVKKK
ncbi:trans-aconitate 3-methyltransferase [Fusarium subglutinans]|uniref:Trans-aconitate 3-methyltransferase n=1 Tax=Gibberella subglutinans TaxID=42677 RepID=A0A8H5L4I4_GIBSU|nr:trans-aconitate 3-methyltransferase [Fusarium subglutinans]KAF5585222.1 trans-aconitate 3-methyltransferase [Fusarium subglutinans]